MFSNCTGWLVWLVHVALSVFFVQLLPTRLLVEFRPSSAGVYTARSVTVGHNDWHTIPVLSHPDWNGHSERDQHDPAQHSPRQGAQNLPEKNRRIRVLGEKRTAG